MAEFTTLTSDRPVALAVEFDHAQFRLTRDYSTGILQLVTRCFEQSEHSQLESALGMQLPHEPNTVMRTETASFAWIAPGQWYAIGPENDIETLQASWREAIAGSTALCLNMSDQLSVLQLDGAATPELLSSLMPIDIRRSEAACLRTALGDISVFLERLETTESVRLIVDQSLCDIACELLIDAANGRLLA